MDEECWMDNWDEECWMDNSRGGRLRSSDKCDFSVLSGNNVFVRGNEFFISGTGTGTIRPFNFVHG